MSLFGAIMSKIFHRKPKAAVTAPVSREMVDAAVGPRSAPVATASPVAAQPAVPQQPVDVEQVLTELAQEKGGGGNWRTSIVDLLKLLDLDSSLQARKELAEELNVHAGEHGSAEQNIALSKAVWQALAQNGGQVPASLKD